MGAIALHTRRQLSNSRRIIRGPNTVAGDAIELRMLSVAYIYVRVLLAYVDRAPQLLDQRPSSVQLLFGKSLQPCVLLSGLCLPAGA